MSAIRKRIIENPYERGPAGTKGGILTHPSARMAPRPFRTGIVAGIAPLEAFQSILGDGGHAQK